MKVLDYILNYLFAKRNGLSKNQIKKQFLGTKLHYSYKRASASAFNFMELTKIFCSCQDILSNWVQGCNLIPALFQENSQEHLC